MSRPKENPSSSSDLWSLIYKADEQAVVTFLTKTPVFFTCLIYKADEQAVVTARRLLAWQHDSSLIYKADEQAVVTQQALDQGPALVSHLQGR